MTTLTSGSHYHFVYASTGERRKQLHMHNLFYRQATQKLNSRKKKNPSRKCKKTNWKEEAYTTAISGGEARNTEGL
jgi:hypothetical protein